MGIFISQNLLLVFLFTTWLMIYWVYSELFQLSALIQLRLSKNDVHIYIQHQLMVAKQEEVCTLRSEAESKNGEVGERMGMKLSCT